MKKERVRISDIAEELGLSTATVSNVIHGKTKKISDETVKRVQELLEKRAYIPSMAGILLAQNNSRIIGVVINDHEKYEGQVLQDGYIASALNALSRKIDQAGYFMMLRVTAQWNEIVRLASMWNMDGLIIMGFCEQDYQKLREHMHIPFVVYDGYFKETQGICNLQIDNYDGGYQVGQYLKSKGYGKVLCISDNCICMDLERMNGCSDAIGKEGVEVLQVPLQKEKRMKFYDEKIEKILSYPAVFAVSDFYAVELMFFLQKRGIRIPEDVSIVGFDDSPLSCSCVPALTTVKQDVEYKAQKALEILESLKKGTEKEKAVKLPVFLVERESVKPNKNEFFVKL